MGFFVNTWCLGSPLEIRPEKTLYNITPTQIYPRQKVIAEVKRGGFKGNFHDVTPSDFFHFLLTNHRAEALLKTGQTNLFQFFANNGSRSLDDYWASIRICMRNGYIPNDASIWRDYIDLLRFFGKDLHNAKYVCPADLKAEHDKYVQKKRAFQQCERRAEARKRALENEARFQQMKSKFFGIQFTDGLIQIRVLESVEEYLQEGDALHHCVFTNNYHLKPDTLILSACLEDKRLETIEISLSKWKVLQSRGLCNNNTAYHDRIIKLVNKHIPQIQKRISA